MGGRLGAISRALAGAILWGIVVAWWYDAPLLRGAWVGFWSWGPAILLSFRWRAHVPDVPLDAFGP
jgi:hypothetical protein